MQMHVTHCMSSPNTNVLQPGFIDLCRTGMRNCGTGHLIARVSPNVTPVLI